MSVFVGELGAARGKPEQLKAFCPTMRRSRHFM